MYDELFCRTHQLIDSRQNGFLKNNSCAMNMTRLIESVSTAVLQDLSTDIIYFDFAKAFGTVNHDLILNKLKYQYNIDGRMLKFFKSYLTNRSQRVVLDNCTHIRCCCSTIGSASTLNFGTFIICSVYK